MNRISTHSNQVAFLEDTYYSQKKPLTPQNANPTDPYKYFQKLSKCHGFSGQGINWSHLRQLTGGCAEPNVPRWYQIPTTHNPNTS